MSRRRREPDPIALANGFAALDALLAMMRASKAPDADGDPPRHRGACVLLGDMVVLIEPSDDTDAAVETATARPDETPSMRATDVPSESGGSVPDGCVSK